MRLAAKGEGEAIFYDSTGGGKGRTVLSPEKRKKNKTHCFK